MVAKRDAKKVGDVSSWSKVFLALAIAGTMMCFQSLMRLIPEKELPSVAESIGWALFLGVFLVYIVPWLWRGTSSRYRLFPHGFSHDTRGSGRFSKWSSYESFSIHDYERFFILKLFSAKRGDREIAVPTEVGASNLTDYLLEVGLDNRPSEQAVPPKSDRAGG